jgi:hypothetical protein
MNPGREDEPICGWKSDVEFLESKSRVYISCEMELV